MKAEEFTKATEDELRQKANECFDKLNTHGSMEKPALLIEAQFYVDEIERRKQDKTAARDYRLEKIVLFLEVIVIILIGLELLDGNRQLSVLDSLNKSADATAKAMKSAQKAQEDALGTQKETLHTIGQMNAAMQDQLNLLSSEQRRQLEAAARGPSARKTLAALISEGVAIRDRAGNTGAPDAAADWERWRTKVEQFLAKNSDSADLQTFKSWNLPGDPLYFRIRNEIGALEEIAKQIGR